MIIKTPRVKACSTGLYKTLFGQFCSLLIAMACICMPMAANAHHIEVLDAVVLQPLPGKNKTVAYVSLSNHSDKDVMLSAVETEQAVVELHETIQQDGRSRMVRHHSVNIPAGQTVQFKKGGKHLMLFRLAPIQTPQLMLRLVFDDGAQFDYPFDVINW